jgi:hypothetical protein
MIDIIILQRIWCSMKGLGRYLQGKNFPSFLQLVQKEESFRPGYNGDLIQVNWYLTAVFSSRILITIWM